jgi:hypothetical protein
VTRVYREVRFYSKSRVEPKGEELIVRMTHEDESTIKIELN